MASVFLCLVQLNLFNSRLIDNPVHRAYPEKMVSLEYYISASTVMTLIKYPLLLRYFHSFLESFSLLRMK